jgi:hypothetical protein
MEQVARTKSASGRTVGRLVLWAVLTLVPLAGYAAPLMNAALADTPIADMVWIPILAVACTLVIGWHRVWQRFELNGRYEVHREYLVSAMEMAKARPLTGYGLGTFPEVYQRYAIKVFPFYANHAHNDWIEFADEGGIPFLLMILVPFAAAIPIALRHPWGLGVVSVMLHACVDFPFARPAVSGWMFLLLGLLYMARTRERAGRESIERSVVHPAPASSTA